MIMEEHVSPLAKDIIEGLQDIIAFNAGNEKCCTVETFALPDTKAIREETGLSQSEFANAYNIPIRTLQKWEQHVHNPDNTASAYLRTIAAMPDEVRKVQENYKNRPNA